MLFIFAFFYHFKVMQKSEYDRIAKDSKAKMIDHLLTTSSSSTASLELRNMEGKTFKEKVCPRFFFQTGNRK
jgi:hypothetical protein